MAKFNLKKEEKIVLNKEGVRAFALEDKEKLATMVLTSMFNEAKFYGDNSKELVELAQKLIDKGQGQFVANLAVFARNEMNLRSVAHVLCSVLAGSVKGKEFVKYAVVGVCQRADDILEILACYLSMYGKPIANSLKKALALCMNKFDEYQFGKYKGASKELTFIDVLRLTHAKAKDAKQNKIFNKIINKELETPYTWETELSAKGNTKEVWEELIDSGKVGLMALVRNLRNILNAGPKNVNKVLAKFRDKESVLRSKILPFRFYSAYKMVESLPNCSSKVLDSLEDAVEISTQNVEKLEGKTLIAIDVSGSMTWPISKNSIVSSADIALLLGAMANKICDDSLVLTFDSRLYSANMSKRGGIIKNARSIDVNGGGTDIRLPVAYILQNKIKVDRIILLSDNEINAGFGYGDVSCQKLLEEYKRKVNPEVFFHGVDLQGYGTSQFKGKNVDLIAGWNEKIFDFMHLAEEGFAKMVRVIENYDEVSEYVVIDAEG